MITNKTQTKTKITERPDTVSLTAWMVLTIKYNITELVIYSTTLWFPQIFSSAPYRETPECRSLPENHLWRMLDIPFLITRIMVNFSMKCIMSGDEKLFSIKKLIVPIYNSEQKAVLQCLSWRVGFVWGFFVIFIFFFSVSAPTEQVLHNTF